MSPPRVCQRKEEQECVRVRSHNITIISASVRLMTSILWPKGSSSPTTNGSSIVRIYYGGITDVQSYANSTIILACSRISGIEMPQTLLKGRTASQQLCLINGAGGRISVLVPAIRKEVWKAVQPFFIRKRGSPGSHHYSPKNKSNKKINNFIINLQKKHSNVDRYSHFNGDRQFCQCRTVVQTLKIMATILSSLYSDAIQCRSRLDKMTGKGIFPTSFLDF